MRVTLFGAAFDPPHFGHQQIAVSLIKEKLADAVWLVPVKQHPFGKKLTPAADRLAMTELLARSIREAVVRENGAEVELIVRVETFELDEPGISYSLKTLSTLAGRYPEHQFSFVIGSDNLPSFHKWDQYETLLNQFPVFVYPRHGFLFKPLYLGMTPMPNMEEVEISSTWVREQLKISENITEMVPSSIAKYIVDHKLYR